RTIAARAGFSDARALRRAVHRWYGTTPGRLRRHQEPRSDSEREDAPPERPPTNAPEPVPHA
ncbi:hypothetical protein ACH4XV_48205, partial [Embleya sp. NPDC020630]